jgi:alpha-L-fucosidase
MTQHLSRRSLLRATVATMGAVGLPAAQAASNPFKPTW